MAVKKLRSWWIATGSPSVTQSVEPSAGLNCSATCSVAPLGRKRSWPQNDVTGRPVAGSVPVGAARNGSR